MKLNLGCGGKPIKGWTNVDKFPMHPEILEAEAHDLSRFPDNTFDEILLSHVIEHLVPEIVPVAMIEWLRVLQPGGFIAIECPDLFKCCVNVLSGMTSRDPEMMVRYGLQGIYGAAETGPGMAHLWGYWPEYLINMLEEAGFSEAYEELPIMKPWQPNPLIRDMRVVAFKGKPE